MNTENTDPVAIVEHCFPVLTNRKILPLFPPGERLLMLWPSPHQSELFNQPSCTCCYRSHLRSEVKWQKLRLLKLGCTSGPQVLRTSPTLRVDNSPYDRHREFSFKIFISRLTDTGSRRLPDSPIPGVGDSPTHRLRISPRIRIGTESCVRDLCKNPFMHKNRKNWSMPRTFKSLAL